MPTRSSHLDQRPERKRRVLLALGWHSSKLHQGVAEYARDAAWSLNVDMERAAALPQRWRGDGIICILGMNEETDRQVISWGLPVVSIGPVSWDQIPNVLPDNRAIARLAYEHFFERGFRHYAIYIRSGGPGERLRLEAFRNHVEKHGGTVDTIDWCAQADRDAVDPGPVDPNWLARRLETLPRPLAIFAEYDDRAIEIVDACENMSIPVPEQVAVLGVDNDEIRCDFAPVPLSSVDDDQRMQGYQAAKLLDELMDGGKAEGQHVLIEPRGVVTRMSTDILAIEHPHVASALRVIWAHYREPLTAGDVADTVPMSNRRLHDAFVKHVGRTISDEIKRRRVEHAQRLLLQLPRRKMEDIASEAGFTSGDRMSKVFLSTTGMTPSAYRRTHSPEAKASRGTGG